MFIKFWRDRGLMADLNQNYRFVALQFCGLLAIVFGLQVFTGFEPGFNASTSPIWKFFTSSLGHSGLEHLLNNLFFIGLFGSIYERLTSGRTFLITFAVSAIFANLTAFIFFPDSVIIGASGGAFGILAALAVYQPRKIGLALGVPLPMWAVLIVYILTNLAGITGNSNVAYEAHLFGIVSGALIGLYLHDFEERNNDEEGAEDENWRERIRRWEDKWMMD